MLWHHELLLVNPSQKTRCCLGEKNAGGYYGEHEGVLRAVMREDLG